jgi:hypothetical protein
MDKVVFVLEDPPVEAIRHACVERAAFAAHDVHPEAFLHGE